MEIGESVLGPSRQGGSSERQSDEEADWLEIVLVDDEGRRVPDAAFEATASDGSRHSGRLNSIGMARLRNVPEGPCEVVFPDLNLRMKV